jgi:hypothetical protein
MGGSGSPLVPPGRSPLGDLPGANRARGPSERAEATTPQVPGGKAISSGKGSERVCCQSSQSRVSGWNWLQANQKAWWEAMG